MVAEQLVGRGITDARVLDAMRRIPRHRFVEEALRDRAYGDHPLPIGESQTISQPYIVGMMTQLLALTGSEKVLEIGTGSGYQTAVLAELVRRVCSVERLMPLAVQARRILEELGYTNAVVKTADGTYGWADEAPFERIIVTAGAPAVPTPLFQQLAEGGRMVVPVGGPQSQVLHVVEKIDGRMRLSTDCGCTFVKLVGKYGWET
jgi:protein-L-isoaspartate(D-aspartate) O-methyltransferase